MMELPWGDDTLRLSLPPRWRLLGCFQPREMSPADAPEVLCRDALAAPLGVAPLADRDLTDQRVLLVADDHSRPTPVRDFFRPVRDALLRAGCLAGVHTGP
jgi:lactate racemase